MKSNEIRRYTMSVLRYYRSEWTDVSDEYDGYMLLVPKELRQLIRECLRRGVSVPNAAKEVDIFLGMKNPGLFVGHWNFEIKSYGQTYKNLPDEWRRDPKETPEDDTDS
jgi:hypothetical protein